MKKLCATMLLLFSTAHCGWAYEILDGTAQPSWDAPLTTAAGQMKDPPSARFWNLTVNKDGEWLCGMIDGKNSFGGYTGGHSFMAKTDGSFVYVNADTVEGLVAEGHDREDAAWQIQTFINLTRKNCDYPIPAN